jgi:hypothetical protein
VTGAPRLTIRRLDSQHLLLEWPASATGYQLETTTSLGAPNWTANLPAHSASSSNGINTVVVETGGSLRLFRLHQP